MDEGLDSEDTCTLGRGIWDRLGGRGGGMRTPLGVRARRLLELPGDEVECVSAGENARCMSVVNSASSASSSLPGCLADIERQCSAGPGIPLGVRGLGRGVVPKPGVCARDGGLVPGAREGNRGNDGLDDGAVDIDEVTGDHGLEEALELRDKLR